ANPFPATLTNLPGRPVGALFILAVGKAAVPMAKAAAEGYGADFDGILLAPEGYMEKVRGFACFEGSHPLPSTVNVKATKKIAEKVLGLEEEDLFLALISGGTSALLCMPAKGVSLRRKIRLTGDLLASGKSIAQVNLARRKLSAIKGGQLKKLAFPADVVSLLLSDVAGDDTCVIGSAPTAGGKVIMNADVMLVEVQEQARQMGISVSNFGSAVTGEARLVARDHAEIAKNYYGKCPHLFLSGGETSVTVTGKGTGGRNSEYALALALALKGAKGIYGLSIDSDGIDGAGPHAGAWVKPDTLEAAGMAGLDATAALKNNDSGGFFTKLDDLITTGPTLTNLNDLRMILMV
ncbi:MAG: DUF4147 domain-containing protein, partial [Sphingomonadales bacterium]